LQTGRKTKTFTCGGYHSAQCAAKNRKTVNLRIRRKVMAKNNWCGKQGNNNLPPLLPLVSGGSQESGGCLGGSPAAHIMLTTLLPLLPVKK